jgi:hypothetical protein
LLDTDCHDHRGGDDSKVELARTFAADVTQASCVDHPDGDREHDGSQYAAWQILKWAGKGE